MTKTRNLPAFALKPLVILLFYANKKSKQTNQQTSVSTSNDEYEKWRRNALAQKPEKQEQPKENQESKKDDEDKTTQQKENQDQSVYEDNSDATQEDDMEEDLALLDDEDMGW